MYRLSDGSHRIEIRDDFNIIMSTEKKPDPGPVFDLFVSLINGFQALHDRLMNQIYPESAACSLMNNIVADTLIPLEAYSR